MQIKIKLLLSALVLFLLQNPRGYKVVNDNSKAWSKLLKKELRRGDFLSFADEVSFPKNKGVLKLVNDKGTYYIRDQEAKTNTVAVNEIWMKVEKSVLPVKSSFTAAGRSGMLNSNYMIRSYFKPFATAGNSLLVVDSLLIQVAPELYTLPNAAYSVQYTLSGITVSVNLQWSKKNKNVYFKLANPDEHVLPEEPLKVSLFAPAVKGAAAVELCSFYISFQSGKVLLPELKQVMQSLLPKGEVAGAHQLQQLKDYLVNFYGYPDREDLNNHLLPLIK